MNLTREQAIYECRKMWNWISEETIMRKRVIKKNEYFEKNNLKIPIEFCYLCEYSFKKSSDYKIEGFRVLPSCYFCTLKFTEIHYIPNCKHKDSPYQKWWDVANNKINKDFNNYQLAAKYAKEIANLPEK